MENILKCIYTISNRGLLDAMFWIMHLWKRLRLGCCRVLLISTYHFLTNAPSTRIRIFLNPQLFLSGFKNFHVRIQIEFARSRVSDTFRGFTPVPRTALGILTTCVVKRAKFASCSAFHGKELGLIWLRIKRLHDSGFLVYSKMSTLESVFKRLQIRMPDTPDTCGRKPYPEGKNCGFRNIRIRVDGTKFYDTIRRMETKQVYPVVLQLAGLSSQQN